MAWENETLLGLKELGQDKFDIVAPSLYVLAEPPVSLVDKVVDNRRTCAVAQAYLDYLYSPEGQNIVGEDYYRPIDPAAAAKFARQFPEVNLSTIDEVFGGWAKAQKTHFADGGACDKVYSRK